MGDIIDAVGEVFSTHNPMQEDDVDLNAVVCPDWFGFARRWTLTENDEPSRWVKAMPGASCVLVFGMLLVVYSQVSSFIAPTGRDVVWVTLTLTLGVMLICLNRVAAELPRLLRADGELATLGLGKTKISATAFAKLVMQRRITRFLQGASVVCAGFASIGFFMAIAWPFIAPKDSVNMTFAFLTIISTSSAYLLYTLVPMVMEFNLTLQVAAELTADATLELVTAIKSISPADTEAWEKQIEGPVLALADGPVAVLSRGWSRGLGLSYFGFWTISLAAFAGFSQLLAQVMSAATPMRVVGILLMLLLTVALVTLPLIMSGAVAEVSTCCDDISNAINARRIEDLDRSPRLLALELALKNLNSNQGLGTFAALLLLSTD